MDNSNKEKKPVIKRNLTAQEQAAINRIKQRGFVNSGQIFRASEENEDGNLDLIIDEKLEHSEAMDLLNSRIMEATGAVNSTVGLNLLTNVGKAIIPSNAKGK